jgi:hypothetical protein
MSWSPRCNPQGTEEFQARSSGTGTTLDLISALIAFRLEANHSRWLGRLIFTIARGVASPPLA